MRKFDLECQRTKNLKRNSVEKQQRNILNRAFLLSNFSFNCHIRFRCRTSRLFFYLIFFFLHHNLYPATSLSPAVFLALWSKARSINCFLDSTLTFCKMRSNNQLKPGTMTMKADECWHWWLSLSSKQKIVRKKKKAIWQVTWKKIPPKCVTTCNKIIFFPVRPIILMICDVPNFRFSRRSVTALLLFSGQDYKDILLPNFYSSPHIALKLRPKTSINCLPGEKSMAHFWFCHKNVHQYFEKLTLKFSKRNLHPCRSSARAESSKRSLSRYSVFNKQTSSPFLSFHGCGDIFQHSKVRQNSVTVPL